MIVLTWLVFIVTNLCNTWRFCQYVTRKKRVDSPFQNFSKVLLPEIGHNFMTIRLILNLASLNVFIVANIIVAESDHLSIYRHRKMISCALKNETCTLFCLSSVTLSSVNLFIVANVIVAEGDHLSICFHCKMISCALQNETCTLFFLWHYRHRAIRFCVFKEIHYILNSLW